MAAKPIERYVKRQIQEQGGWPRILERIASGETVAGIARTILRPDGVSISRNFLSMLLHADPERSALAKLAHIEGASAMVDDALQLVDRAPVDRDSVNKAKVQSETRLKVAGFLDRTSWGEQKQAINLNVSVNSLHVDALRHRVVEASRPAIEGYAQIHDGEGLAAAVGSSEGVKELDTSRARDATVEATVVE